MITPRSPSRLLGVVSALGVTAGCSDPCESLVLETPPEPSPSAEDPPTVIAGEWLTAGVLELHFSKAIASFGDLDPARFEVVAWAIGGNEVSGSCNAATRYRWLFGGGYYYYGAAPRPSQVWIAPENPTILRVRLANSGATCPNPAFNSSAAIESGVMLVYTGPATADGPELLDEDGVAVPAFGSDWLLDRLAACVDGTYGYYFCPLGDLGGHLPGLASLVPIPCP
jgi:hypothetical protein